MTEAQHQEALIDWSALYSKRWPELELLYHIPNGGKRNASEAAHLKRQGVKAGVPDLCLPVARGDHHGLYIELKARKNKPTEHQLSWIQKLSDQGYVVAVCWGWEQAAKVIVDYLEGRT